MENKKRLKIAVIAGASRALKLKAINPQESDDKILKRVSNQADEIVDNIEA